jgi:hypothetical protein
MTITAERFLEQHSDEWDEFIEQRARNGTFLHGRKFFRHNPANAIDDASLLFRDGGRIAGVFPAALVTRDGAPSLESHPRSTYGGYVVGQSAGLRDVLAMVDATIAHARSLGAARIVVRNPFRIFHRAPSDESDYAMWLRGFTVRSRELEVAIPLDGLTPDTVLQSFDGKTRNQTRKAAKAGVVVEETGDYAEFWRILEENLRARHGTAPTHSLEAMQSLRALVSPDAIRLFAAFHEGRMIAGMVLFVPNARAVHAQYIASRSDALHLCPVNAVIAHVATWAAARGFHHFNLGMSTEDAGRTANWGLFAFKEGFGGRGVLRETMSFDL